MGSSTFLALIAAAFGLNDTSAEQAAVIRAMQGNNLGHKATPPRGHSNSAHTQRYFHESKTRRKMAAESRKINRRH